MLFVRMLTYCWLKCSTRSFVDFLDGCLVSVKDEVCVFVKRSFGRRLVLLADSGLHVRVNITPVTASATVVTAPAFLCWLALSLGLICIWLWKVWIDFHVALKSFVWLSYGRETFGLTFMWPWDVWSDFYEAVRSSVWLSRGSESLVWLSCGCKKFGLTFMWPWQVCSDFHVAVRSLVWLSCSCERCGLTFI